MDRVEPPKNTGSKITHTLRRISKPSFSKPCLRGAHTTKMVALGKISSRHLHHFPWPHRSVFGLSPLSRKSPSKIVQGGALSCMCVTRYVCVLHITLFCFYPLTSSTHRVRAHSSSQRVTSSVVTKLRTQRYYILLIQYRYCLLYTSPSPRDGLLSRMPSSA